MKTRRFFALTGLATLSLGLIFCACQASSVLSEGRAARLAALSVEPTPKAPTVPVAFSDLEGVWQVTGYVPSGGYQGVGRDQPCPATLHEIPSWLNTVGKSVVGCGEMDMVRFDVLRGVFTEEDAMGRIHAMDSVISDPSDLPVNPLSLSLSKSQTNSPLSVVSGKYSLENSILTVVMTDVNYSKELKFKVNFIKKSVIESKEVEKKYNNYNEDQGNHPATGLLETETKMILKSPGIISLRQISQTVNGRRVTDEDGSELILTLVNLLGENGDDYEDTTEIKEYKSEDSNNKSELYMKNSINISEFIKD